MQLEFPLTRDNLIAAFRKALNWNRPFADRPERRAIGRRRQRRRLRPNEVGTMLRPIATPLVMSGFEPDLGGDARRRVPRSGLRSDRRRRRGLRPGEMPFDGPLKPGDAVGVTFVSGDLLLGGTGTVTHIDGDRVYAFGHPMYNLGPTEFPMTRAYVYTVLPSLFSSMKLSTTGEVIGTLLQDRATAIAGRLGPGPR